MWHADSGVSPSRMILLTEGSLGIAIQQRWPAGRDLGLSSATSMAGLRL
jgi:hypothetical protein